MAESLPAHLAALLSPKAYPHPVEAVQLIETHVSWVLLAGQFAYKIKRPVHYAFIDLRSPERRAFFCAEELRLNRRFAPHLYVDVCEIVAVNGEARIGGTGEVIEHAVCMRRFDREEELDRLLAAGRIEPHELEAFGRDLADIHRRLPIATAVQGWGRPDAVRRAILENLRECAQAAAIFDAGAEVLALRDAMIARLDSLQQHLAARLANEHIRECHGDLHARNIVRLQGRLIAFDCLEFEPAFRWIDTAEELAFLLADLDARGYGLHAHAFLTGYLTQSGAYSACRLLGLYKSHHALIRAKMTALAAASVADARARKQEHEQCSAYIDTARRALEQGRPMLVLMSGLSGSGKTWLASRLAGPLGAIHLRSDIERKRLAGLPEQARLGSAIEHGLYSREASARVYKYLASCAEEVLSGGYTVIVDATFMRGDDRAHFSRLASTMGVELRLIHCHAPVDILRARVTQRHAGGKDASEADLAVLQWQIQHREAIQAEEGFDIIDVDSAAAEPVPSFMELLARVRPNH